MISQYVGTKIKVISAFAMGLVVLVHSYNYDEKLIGSSIFNTRGFTFFLENFISNGFAGVAVPIFFAVSSYLFFLNTNSVKAVFPKMQKRFRTLVLPYLLWSIWGLLLYFLLQSIPFSKTFFTKDLVAEYSFYKTIRTIFIDPIPYQLWFLKELIVLMFLSPVLYYLIKFSKYALAIITMILWCIDFQMPYLSMDSINFFTLGATVAMLRPSVINLTFSRKYWVMGIVWIAILLFITINIDQKQFDLLRKISVLVGLVTVWTIYDVFLINKDLAQSRFYSLFSYSFFVYVFHEPILIIIKKGMIYMLPKTELSVLLTYLLSPVIIISLSLIVGGILNRWFNKFYNVLTGGR
ncbi:MAG: hypothetical protein EOO44_17750 [Flavobacterium sp.]|nr:MAG: hypothetical protein EOO44_17750 [Flavobacterium sp.]